MTLIALLTTLFELHPKSRLYLQIYLKSEQVNTSSKYAGA